MPETFSEKHPMYESLLCAPNYSLSYESYSSHDPLVNSHHPTSECPVLGYAPMIARIEHCDAAQTLMTGQLVAIES